MTEKFPQKIFQEILGIIREGKIKVINYQKQSKSFASHPLVHFTKADVLHEKEKKILLSTRLRALGKLFYKLKIPALQQFNWGDFAIKTN